jgi:RecA/RadA recombinase
MRKPSAALFRSKSVFLAGACRETAPVPGSGLLNDAGGNALKFHSSVRLDIRQIGSIEDGEEVIGNLTRVKAMSVT